MYEKNDLFTLIDVLPPKHYANAYLRNAINICVYEMSFITVVNELNLEKNSKIIVYGNNHNDVDAKAAYEKLSLENYSDIHYLKKGLFEISSEFLEGENLRIDEEQTLDIPNKKFLLSSGNTLSWTGKNTNGSHKGTINLTNGFIQSQKNVLSGEFIVDMKSIKTTDLTPEQGSDYLDIHLNSEDFFFTKIFPEATFSFSNVVLEDEAYLTSNNCRLEGTLTIRGISKTFVCSTNFSFSQDKLILTSSFSFDRTFWDIIYGSTKFFKYLGMHKVFDDINIELRLELK